MSYRFHAKALAAIPALIDDVARAVETGTEALRADRKLSKQGRDEQIAALRAGAEARIALLREEAASARDSAAHWASQTLRAQRLDPTEGLLAETQQGRAWDRAVRQLDAGADASELIQRAGEAGDVVTLNALRAELPAYLEAKASESAPPLHASIARNAARNRAEALAEAIDRAEAPHVPLDRRKALTAKYELEALDRRIGASVLLAQAAITDRPMGPALIRAGLAQQELDQEVNVA